MAENGIGARSLRKEDQRFITGKGRYTDDINRTAKPMPCSCAPRTPTPRSSASTRRVRLAAGRAGGARRRRRRRRRARRPDLRLGGQVEGRLRHEDRAAPAPGAGQGPLCRRPGRRGRRRDLRPGQGRGRSWSMSTTRSCRPWSISPRRTMRRRWSTTRSRATASTTGSSATRRRSTRRSPARRTSPSIDLVNNRLVPNAMEPRAAIGHYDSGHRPVHLLHHQPEPARATDWSSRPSSRWRRSTSCG